VVRRGDADGAGTVPAVATSPPSEPPVADEPSGQRPAGASGDGASGQADHLADERAAAQPTAHGHQGSEHPVVDAAVAVLGGTTADTERPPESPVQPVLPAGLRGYVARFDREVDRSFQVLRDHPPSSKVMYALSALGDFSLLWHIVGTARALRGPADERAAVRLGTSLLVESVLINGMVKSLFRRERPEWEQERAHRIRKPRSSSFPSGHATSGFMAATLLVDGRRRSAPFWYGLASMVAASRVHVRIHHPSDVVAGA
jgi:undecaprenyl-diphosphatase